MRVTRRTRVPTMLRAQLLATSASFHQESQQPHAHQRAAGGGPRTWQRRPQGKQGHNSPSGRYGAKAPGGKWALRPLGVLGSPWFQTECRQAVGHAVLPLQAAGCWSPTLAVWRARTQGRVLLNDIGTHSGRRHPAPSPPVQGGGLPLCRREAASIVLLRECRSPAASLRAERAWPCDLHAIIRWKADVCTHRSVRGTESAGGQKETPTPSPPAGRSTAAEPSRGTRAWEEGGQV